MYNMYPDYAVTNLGGEDPPPHPSFGGPQNFIQRGGAAFSKWGLILNGILHKGTD